MQGDREWEAAEQNSKGQPRPRRSGQEGLTVEAGGGGGGSLLWRHLLLQIAGMPEPGGCLHSRPYLCIGTLGAPFSLNRFSGVGMGAGSWAPVRILHPPGWPESPSGTGRWDGAAMGQSRLTLFLSVWGGQAGHSPSTPHLFCIHTSQATSRRVGDSELPIMVLLTWLCMAGCKSHFASCT